MKTFKKYLPEYLIIALGSFILAFGISLFLVPLKISTGGVSGIGTVLLHLLKIPMSISTLVINLALFGLGFKFLPKSSIIKTLFGIAAYSLSFEVTERISPFITSWMGQGAIDVWVAAIFGGVLVGVGVGLVVSKEASTGGSDFAALMLHKLIPYMTVASFIMIIDTAIIVISSIALGDFSLTFYSIVSLYISNTVTDFMLVHGDEAKQIHTISNKNDEIAAAIMEKLERGVTAIHSKGCYSGEEKEMLLCLVRTKEVPRVLGIINEIDPDAFTIVSEAIEVRGLGFKEII